MNEWFNLFVELIVPFSMIIPLAAFIIRYKHTPVYARWIFVYLIVSALLNITAIIMATLHKNNLWLFHLNTVLESFLLIHFFYLILRNPVIKSIAGVLRFVFPLFCIFNFLFLQNLAEFNTYARPFESIILVGLSMFYWWRANEEDTDTSWGNIATNWFITGIMFYFAGSFFLFLFSNFMLDGLNTESKRNAAYIIWSMHGIFVLIMYLLFALGFLKCKK